MNTTCISRAGLTTYTARGVFWCFAATAGCTTQVDSSSWMSGAKWLSSFQLYTQVCSNVPVLPAGQDNFEHLHKRHWQ